MNLKAEVSALIWRIAGRIDEYEKPGTFHVRDTNYAWKNSTGSRRRFELRDMERRKDRVLFAEMEPQDILL